MSTLVKTTFSTGQFAPRERFPIWRDSINVLFDTRLDSAFAPEDFNARLDGAVLGQVLFGKLSSVSQAFSRSEAKILNDGLDCYLVQVFTWGHCEVKDGPHIRIVRPGDIYIIDASAPLEAINHGFETITALIPRDLIRRNLVQPDMHHRRIIPADMPLAKLLYTFICTLAANRSSMSAADGIASMGPLLGLVEGVLNAPVQGALGAAPEQALDFAVVNAVKDHIEANLTNHALSPESVASDLGLSRSRLYRLFQPMGGVSAYIRNRRLRRSLQDLLVQGARSLRIGEIAWRYGFGSETHYSRAFRLRYGMSPGEARRSHSPLAHSSNQPSSDYESWIRALAQ